VGLDDRDFIGSEAGKTGLHALDRVQDLALLLVPGRATPAVHNAMLRYCEVARSGTVFAVLDPPANQSAAEMVTYVSLRDPLIVKGSQHCNPKTIQEQSIDVRRLAAVARSAWRRLRQDGA
jgi:hypothetical protein